ncbi:MAG: hypothetical protein ACPGEC_02240 [Flavobacteriales bacterium]
MKIIKYLTLVFLFALFSCETSQKNTQSSHFLVHGEAEALAGEHVLLFQNQTVFSSRVVDTILVNQDGEFRFSVDDSLNFNYTLRSKKIEQELYLKPNGSLNIRLLPENPTQFEGSLGAENTYLQTKKQLKIQFINQALYQLSEVDFEHKTVQLRKTFLQALKKAPLTLEFQTRERLAIDYILASLFLNYPYVNQSIIEGKSKLSTAFKSKIDNYIVELDGGMHVSEYADFFSYLVLYEVQSNAKFNQLSVETAVKHYFKNPENQYLLMKMLF